MKQNKVLVILGMHRSGTSLITRWLQACGLHIGDTLLGAETGNDEGHFEDLDFIHLHEQLLTTHKLPHTGLTSEPINGITITEEETIQKLINTKSNQHEQWAWKDPRTCMFLDTYRKLIPNAQYIIILRDYQAVVSSLLNRDNKGLQRYYSSKGTIYKFFLKMKKKYNMNWVNETYAEKYLKVWIAYSEALLKHIQAISEENYIVIDYLTLLDDDRPFFNHLASSGFRLQYADFNTVFNKNLVGKPLNVAALIDDTSLLSKARRLENELRNTVRHPH